MVRPQSVVILAYHVNLLKNIPALLNQYVPMSLLSKDSLEIVLDKVAVAQTRELDRLTLAIPFQELLSYYETRLFQGVMTLPKGLMMTVSKPLASRRTVMTTYQALPLLVPQIDEVDALQWTYKRNI